MAFNMAFDDGSPREMISLVLLAQITVFGNFECRCMFAQLSAVRKEGNLSVVYMRFDVKHLPPRCHLLCGAKLLTIDRRICSIEA